MNLVGRMLSRALQLGLRWVFLQSSLLARGLELWDKMLEGSLTQQDDFDSLVSPPRRNQRVEIHQPPVFEASTSRHLKLPASILKLPPAGILKLSLRDSTFAK